MDSRQRAHRENPLTHPAGEHLVNNNISLAYCVQFNGPVEKSLAHPDGLAFIRCGHGAEDIGFCCYSFLQGPSPPSLSVTAFLHAIERDREEEKRRMPVAYVILRKIQVSAQLWPTRPTALFLSVSLPFVDRACMSCPQIWLRGRGALPVALALNCILPF